MQYKVGDKVTIAAEIVEIDTGDPEIPYKVQISPYTIASWVKESEIVGLYTPVKELNKGPASKLALVDNASIYKIVEMVLQRLSAKQSEAEANKPPFTSVEAWMKYHNCEPWISANGIAWWDGPDHAAGTCGNEKLPADVWAVMTDKKSNKCEHYDSRDDAITALRNALLRLKLI